MKTNVICGDDLEMPMYPYLGYSFDYTTNNEPVKIET